MQTPHTLRGFAMCGPHFHSPQLLILFVAETRTRGCRLFRNYTVKAAAMGKAILLYENRESHAAIKGHPIHPMIVPFPIACWAGAFAADVASMYTLAPIWMAVAEWLLAIGIGTAAVAAVLGLVDFASIKAARNRTGWIHAIGNATAATLALINLGLRLSAPTPVVTEAEMALSTIVFFMLLVTGWMGGELVFRHHIGAIQPETPRSD
jgi:uncharacterized membrane protein